MHVLTKPHFSVQFLNQKFVISLFSSGRARIVAAISALNWISSLLVSLGPSAIKQRGVTYCNPPPSPSDGMLARLFRVTLRILLRTLLPYPLNHPIMSNSLTWPKQIESSVVSFTFLVTWKPRLSDLAFMRPTATFWIFFENFPHKNF